MSLRDSWTHSLALGNKETSVVFSSKLISAQGKIIASENLGKLKFVKSDFMFNGEYNPNNRLYNIDLGGGSLLDIGIYSIFTALIFLGIPDEIKGHSIYQGVDLPNETHSLLRWI